MANCSAEMAPQHQNGIKSSLQAPQMCLHSGRPPCEIQSCSLLPRQPTAWLAILRASFGSSRIFDRSGWQPHVWLGVVARVASLCPALDSFFDLTPSALPSPSSQTLSKFFYYTSGQHHGNPERQHGRRCVNQPYIHARRYFRKFLTFLFETLYSFSPTIRYSLCYSVPSSCRAHRQPSHGSSRTSSTSRDLYVIITRPVLMTSWWH